MIARLETPDARRPPRRRPLACLHQARLTRLTGFGVIGKAMGGLHSLTGEPGRVQVRRGVSTSDTLLCCTAPRHADGAAAPHCPWWPERAWPRGAGMH